MTPKKNEYVLVTTKYSGIFFGKVVEADLLPQEITLSECRNCIRWHLEIEGFLGLTQYGPSDRCLIGATAPQETLYDITSWGRLTKDAIKKWKA